MKIEIGNFERKDYKKAVQFAEVGMHSEWFWPGKALMLADMKYFLYTELLEATQILAARTDGQFAGVLLAAMRGEEKPCRSRSVRRFVRRTDRLLKLFGRGAVGEYEKTAKEQRERSREMLRPDGEILFFAVDPGLKGKGIGSALLAELERREAGRSIYLLTDDACSWEFYDHRGFRQTEQKDIVIEAPKGSVPLRCFVYYKVMGQEAGGER